MTFQCSTFKICHKNISEGGLDTGKPYHQDSYRQTVFKRFTGVRRSIQIQMIQNQRIVASGDRFGLWPNRNPDPTNTKSLIKLPV